MKIITLRTFIKFLACLLFPLGLLADPGLQLTVREIRYDAMLADNEARFGVDLDLEATGKGEAALPLLNGDIAVLTTKLPVNLRLVRDGTQYRVVVTRAGRYKFKLDLVAKIVRQEPWNQVSFTGPEAAIASVTARAGGAGTDLQLLSGTLQEAATKDGTKKIRGFLGRDQQVALRWSRERGPAETARKALLTCETTANVQVTPTVVKYNTQLRYEILQGTVTELILTLPASQALTKLQGEGVRDWQLKPAGTTTNAGQQILTIDFIKPIEKNYQLLLLSEQTIDSTTPAIQVVPPQPQTVERETGSLTVAAEDVLVETDSVSGLRQVNAGTGAMAAYQFYTRPFTLALKLRRIEPVLNASDRVTARIEESRVLVNHALTVTIEKAGIYALELTPQTNFVVADVRGEGIDDWKMNAGKLALTFNSRILGSRRIDVQLERAFSSTNVVAAEQPAKKMALPDKIEIKALRVTSAVRETAQIGAAAAAGLQLKTVTDGLTGVREIAINRLANRSDESLAYNTEQADWVLAITAERLAPRITANVFNLVTIGDGLLGGSATIRYAIINQGVQEFKVRVPSRWKNVEFTGPNIRRKDQADDIWTISLQEKAWGGYTLVLTYDYQFDPHKASLAIGGIHCENVERETGSIALTSAADLQIQEVKSAGATPNSATGVTDVTALDRIDEGELAANDRALITHPVLMAYRYAGRDYNLDLDVTRFDEMKVLDAAADRTQLTTVLTEDGQMLTQASFMVKNNDRQFQTFTMPEGADFWACYVSGEPTKPERNGARLLVPLPRQLNRDQAFPVDIVYVQKIAPLKNVAPRTLALAAPVTDMQTTYAEWELYVPPSLRLANFGGNMIVARGTTYGLRDAWNAFRGFYGSFWANPKRVFITYLLFILLLSAIASYKWGKRIISVGLVLLTIIFGVYLVASVINEVYMVAAYGMSDPGRPGMGRYFGGGVPNASFVEANNIGLDQNGDYGNTVVTTPGASNNLFTVNGGVLTGSGNINIGGLGSGGLLADQDLERDGLNRTIQRLNKIVIPEIKFRESSLPAIVNYLAEQSRLRDPEHMGVNIVLGPGVEGGPQDAGMTISGSGGRTITLSLKNVPLIEALKYVVSLANLKYRVESSAVLILPLDAPDQQMVTKTYRVTPGVFTRMLAAPGSGGGAGGSEVKGIGESTPATTAVLDLKQIFTDAGVAFPAGGNLSYDDKSSTVTIHDTPDNVEAFERVLPNFGVSRGGGRGSGRGSGYSLNEKIQDGVVVSGSGMILSNSVDALGIVNGGTWNLGAGGLSVGSGSGAGFGSENALIISNGGQIVGYNGAGNNEVTALRAGLQSLPDLDEKVPFLGDLPAARREQQDVSGKQLYNNARGNYALNLISSNAFLNVGALNVGSTRDARLYFAQTTPMVAGIRPIRIDIPKQGQRFVFTKVLNVQAEPLAIRVSAMEQHVFNTVRGSAQALAFVVGLIITLWQMRRFRKNSLVLAIGLALLLGSIGSVLISWRMLHLALILEVPVMVFVICVWLILKFWKKKVVKIDDQGENGPAPKDFGVATPVIILLLLLSCAGARAGVTNEASILSASYTGAIHALDTKEAARAGQFEAVVVINTSSDNQTVHLFNDDLAVEEFSATPTTVKLERQNNGVSVVIPRKGTATVKFKFLVKTTGDVASRQVGFAIPAALVSHVAVTLDEPEAQVDAPTAVSFKSTTTGQQTTVDAILGASERVELTWTPRVKRAADMATTVFCNNAALVTVSGGAVDVRATLDYQVTQGELRQMHVAIPEGQHLMRVEGESIRTWKLDGQILSVELVKGVTPAYRLTVETEVVRAAGDLAVAKDGAVGRPAPNKDEALPIEVPHAIEVKRETGLLALMAADELSVSVADQTDLQKVDVDEFTRVVSAGLGRISSAYRFLKPEFKLSVKVEPLQPQIEALVRNHARVTTEQVALRSVIDYTIKRAGVFTLRLALPDDYRVDAVNGYQIAQWVEKAGPPRVLEVTLRGRTQGDYNLTVDLVRNLKELPKSLEITGIQPLDTEKLNGFVTASAEEGVQIRTESFDGLSEVPAQLLLGAEPSSNVLGFKLIPGDSGAVKPGWKLTVATEKIESWVRAEVANTVTLSDTLVSGRSVVRYDIANAPTKEFRVRVPARFHNVEVTGANIRRKDHDEQTGEWHIELQNKVRGIYELAVTWDMPWDAKSGALEVVGVEAPGVERETGSVAIIAPAKMRVEAKNMTSDLLQVDVRELPEWATHTGGDMPVLAYRYLRAGFQLTLVTQRFDEAEVLQALIDNVRLTTVVSEDGQMMTEISLAVRNNARQYLEIALPLGSTNVWSAFVNGQAVRPSVRNGKLLLPMERSQGDATVPVELTYVGTSLFPRGQGVVDLISPALDVPLKNAHWELYLPPDYIYRNFGGTMQRAVSQNQTSPDGGLIWAVGKPTAEPAAAPVVMSYGLREYAAEEQRKVAVQSGAAQTTLSNARIQLANGNVKGANDYLSQAKDNSFAVNQGEYKSLKKDIQRAQANNLIQDQGQLLTGNRDTLHVQGQAYSAGAGNSVLTGNSGGAMTWQGGGAFQTAGLVPNQPVPSQYIEEAAEQQAAKLQAAQEVTVSKAVPLRVNLPKRGIYFAFSQVLQTQPGKPMTVQFSATNEGRADWPAKIGISAVAFLALWGAMALVVARRRE